MSEAGRGGGAGGGGGGVEDRLGGGSWTSMNENLMVLLEAVLSLAATDATMTRRESPRIKPGGYSEDIFLDLSEDEKEQFSCSICYQVLKETMQCLNKHKFCHSCLYVWSTTGQYANRVRCPVCRCHGYYFRDDHLDAKIQQKRVRCVLSSCKWTGPVKQLKVHRHTTYATARARHLARRQIDYSDEEDEDEEEEEEEEEGRGNVLELPYLGRAPPHVPHRSMSRFAGTGLQARTLMTSAAPVSSPLGDEGGGGDPTVHTTTTPLGRVVGRGGGGALLRERRNSNANTEAGSGDMSAAAAAAAVPERRLSVRQRVHPIRRSSVNRITVRHTDGNNNVAATPTAVPDSTDADSQPRSLALSPESALASPRQPRPPSGPRPSNSTSRRRNLPGLSAATVRRPRTPSVSNTGQASPPPPTTVGRAPPAAFNAASASRGTGLTVLTGFEDRLQESRDRLEGLMANFSGELERSRQEMADFQVERERQRREQLAEVRELGRRLGQVASELRNLLGPRRGLRPSDADD